MNVHAWGHVVALAAYGPGDAAAFLADELGTARPGVLSYPLADIGVAAAHWVSPDHGQRIVLDATATRTPSQTAALVAHEMAHHYAEHAGLDHARHGSGYLTAARLVADVAGLAPPLTLVDAVRWPSQDPHRWQPANAERHALSLLEAIN